MPRQEPATTRGSARSANPPHPAGPRVLLYSHDGFGLGHLQRNFQIARLLTAALPGADALLVTGSPHGFDSRLPAGVDFVKLPSVLKAGQGVWEPRTLRVGETRLRELRAAMLHGAVTAFAPDLVVVDFLPTGVWGELLPVLAACRAATHPPRVVLGLRDILDSPEATRRLWQRTGAYQAVETLYDRILVYGHREMFDAGALYGFDASMTAKLVYCGYLAPAPAAAGAPDGGTTSDAAEAPEIDCPPAVGGESRDPRGPCGPCIVATAGGGADAFPLLRACVEALRRMVAETAPAPRAVLVAGPLMPERQRADLRRLASGLPIEVHWQVDDVPALLATADAVVAMAGYNTLVEAVAARRRIVAVPRRGPSAEQSMRADLFHRRGLVDVVPPDQLSAATLAAALRRALAAPPPPPFAMDGRNAVLRELTSLWAEDRRAAEPVAAYGSLPTAVPPPQGAASLPPRPVHASPAP